MYDIYKYKQPTFSSIQIAGLTKHRPYENAQ